MAMKMKSKGYSRGGMKMKSKMKAKGYKAGGKKFPDLNKDGKVTQADILMGRGVGGKKSKDKKPAAAKKPAGKRTMMPGMTSAKMPKIKGAEGIDKKGVYQEGGSVKPKGMKAGGMKSKMKTKGGSAGGGYKKGGMKSKMSSKGGMKSKMSSKGGAKGGKKPTTQKVRGAGIARKGVRPAKMR